MAELISESPVECAAAVAFVSQAINSRRATAIKIRGIAKILGVGAQSDLPEIPVTGMVVMRVGGVVDVRVVLKFTDNVAVLAPAFHYRNFAVFEMNFHAGPKAAGAVGAGDHAVSLGVGGTVSPFGKVFRIIVKVLTVLPGCGVGIHQQMPTPVDTAQPSLGHLLRNIPSDIGTLGILYFDLINIASHHRDGLFFNQLPQLSRKGRNLTDNLPAVGE